MAWARASAGTALFLQDALSRRLPPKEPTWTFQCSPSVLRIPHWKVHVCAWLPGLYATFRGGHFVLLHPITGPPSAQNSGLQSLDFGIKAIGLGTLEVQVYGPFGSAMYFSSFSTASYILLGV